MRHLGSDLTSTKFFGLPITRPDTPAKPGEFPKALADALRAFTKNKRNNSLNVTFAKFIRDGYLINQGLVPHMLTGINSDCLKHLANVTNDLLPFANNIIESLKQPGAVLSESDARILKAYTDSATALADASSSLKSLRLFNAKNGDQKNQDPPTHIPKTPRFYESSPAPIPNPMPNS